MIKGIDAKHSSGTAGGRIYEQREATVSELANILGLSFVKNNAAFYLFPKLDVKGFHITDERKFDRDLLHATNILLVPGSGFDWQEPDHFLQEMVFILVRAIRTFLSRVRIRRNQQSSMYHPARFIVHMLPDILILQRQRRFLAEA